MTYPTPRVGQGPTPTSSMGGTMPATSHDRFAQGSFSHATPAHPPLRDPFPGSDRVDPAQVFRGPGYASPLPASNRLAEIAVWLSPVGLILPPVLVILLIMGIIAWLRAEDLHGAGLRGARGAVFISTIGALLWLALYVAIRLLT